MARDPRIDAYIASVAPFARPILEHLRDFVEATIPEADETIKWGMPHLTVQGKNLAGMSAFKAHCAFAVHGAGSSGDAYGQYGRIASLADLPDAGGLAAALRAARDRIATTGSATPARKARSEPRPEIAMPDDFAAALDPGARAFLDRLAPSHRREYLEWIVSAKRPETRARRIASAAAQLAEGRKLNWKYER